ncbi:hypothetical protein LEMLEM_LOCUS15448, partial [Lemmus lemmus]
CLPLSLQRRILFSKTDESAFKFLDNSTQVQGDETSWGKFCPSMKLWVQSPEPIEEPGAVTHVSITSRLGPRSR